MSSAGGGDSGGDGDGAGTGRSRGGSGAEGVCEGWRGTEGVHKGVYRRVWWCSQGWGGTGGCEGWARGRAGGANEVRRGAGEVFGVQHSGVQHRGVQGVHGGRAGGVPGAAGVCTVDAQGVGVWGPGVCSGGVGHKGGCTEVAGVSKVVHREGAGCAQGRGAGGYRDVHMGAEGVPGAVPRLDFIWSWST